MKWWPLTDKGDCYADAAKKQGRKGGLFSHIRLHDQQPSPTLTCATNDHSAVHWNECRRLTYREWKRLGSFPDDYHAKTDKIGKYMIGMSVPPKMTEQVARAVIDQWLIPNAPHL